MREKESERSGEKKRVRERTSRGRNDFLSLQLLIMSGIAGETFKSIIRAGRLVLIKRQTTCPYSSIHFGSMSDGEGLLFRGRVTLTFRCFPVEHRGVVRREGTREKTNPAAGLIYELLLSIYTFDNSVSKTRTYTSK